MTPIIICIWMAAGLVLFLALLDMYLAYVYRRVCLERNRYKLFAVRDRFTALVTEGHLTEDDPVFHHYYHLSNKMVMSAHLITLNQFLKALKSSDEEVRKNHKKLVDAVNSKNEGVKEAVNLFYGTVCEILVSNSLLLKVVITLGLAMIISATAYKSVIYIFAKIFPPFYSFHFYEEYSEMKQSVHASA